MTRRISISGILLLLAALSSESAPQATVSANRVDDVPRIKLYAATPNVVAGRETELDPTEPTLDIYLPPPDKSTGAGVLILPGGGYQMLTVPGEGAVEDAVGFLNVGGDRGEAESGRPDPRVGGGRNGEHRGPHRAVLSLSLGRNRIGTVIRPRCGQSTQSSRHTPCAVGSDGTRSVPTTFRRPARG